MTAKKKPSVTAKPAAAPPPLYERRKFERVGIPSAAFAQDATGHELGSVLETSGGGLRLSPASPWARLSLKKGQQLMLTIVEPATGNATDVYVEVTHTGHQTVGLRFL
ncbi:MAG: PilZ domain-containing protein [Acidobacteriota bacterium]|nr:PilZ domain-containing protein [Acidobacteriota bacterium]